MASKKPVVASDVGGVPEIVVDGETGILVAPKDEEALAKAIRYVKEHPEKASEMGEKGFMRVKQDFQLSRTVEATEQLYLELMQQSL
jgi:glycosyltransferase involved in cell wall biosynthesis